MISNHDHEILEKAKALFTEKLEEGKLRKTPERYAILEEIYSIDNHFDAEALFIHMKQREYHVSRATVYNTLDLLVHCELVIKHQFGKNLAQYERAYGQRQHDHLICTECGKVIEFCDPRIQQIKSSVSDMLNFKVEKHSLYMYGTCSDECQEKKEKSEL